MVFHSVAETFTESPLRHGFVVPPVPSDKGIWEVHIAHAVVQQSIAVEIGAVDAMAAISKLALSSGASSMRTS